MMRMFDKTDEPLKERMMQMRLSNFIASKDRDVLQARNVCVIHRRHLSTVNDRAIGTQKGMGRFSLKRFSRSIIS